MADLKKFEEMLERLVNEDKEGAEELFHEIVVEKSREIYEGLLEAELEDEEVDEATDEEVDESDDEEVDEASDEEVDESDEDLDENFDLDEFEVEADPMDMAMGGDAGDDMMGDLEMPADDGEEGGEEGEEDLEDRVMDLEDALEDLKAEFDAMMNDGDDDAEEPEMDMDVDMGDDDDGEEEPEEEAYAFESDDEEVDEASDEEVEEKKDEDKSASETMREYVEKVTATMGDTGTNGTKSAVAGKNDMGGTAGNIAQANTGDVAEAGAGSSVKGNALNQQTAKEDNAGNVNVPGGKAAKAGKTQPGHGAEKKGKPETADKSAQSTLNGVSTRAK